MSIWSGVSLKMFLLLIYFFSSSGGFVFPVVLSAGVEDILDQVDRCGLDDDVTNLLQIQSIIMT